MAHSHSFLYQLPTTGLRFFNAYGPWGRPDSAIYIFTRAILEGTPINVYNSGKMERDFTFVDDIADGIVRLLDLPPKWDPLWNAENSDPSTSSAPYRIYNIGNHQPVGLNRLIEVLEDCIGRKSIRNDLPMQKGDILNSFADTEPLLRETGFQPNTPIEEGVRRFVAWFKDYYNLH